MIPSLEEEPCVVLDTETAGPTWPVIELAVIGLRSGQVLLHSRYDLPEGATWSEHAERVHNIPRSALRGLSTCLSCRGAILDVLRGRVLIGHNLLYDVRALVRTLEVRGLEEARQMCTLKMAQRYLPGLTSYKLGPLAEQLGITFTGQAHTALADTEAARQVYLAIRERVQAARAERPDAFSAMLPGGWR